jgi:hypothetical protein
VSGTCDAHVWVRGERFTEFFAGRPEGMRPPGKPRHRWEDNIKVDLRETGINGSNWIQLAQDRVQWQAFVSTIMTIQIP